MEHAGRDGADERAVALQLGREPRGRWRVSARCTYGAPTVILTPPLLADESPFPTLYYLTCPFISEQVSAIESQGGAASWAMRLREDASAAREMLAADAEYRARRVVEAEGSDPMPGVGIAGQRDPLATKCLHAHVAAALAGIADPVGIGVLEGIETECAQYRCREARGTGE